MVDSPIWSSSPTITRSSSSLASPRRKAQQPRDANGHFVSLKTDESRLVVKDGMVEIDRYRLMYVSFEYFMSELKDDKGTPLIVARHHEEWCELMSSRQRLCILAPRDHGKTWTSLCYLMWKAWKHNRDQYGQLRKDLPDGEFQAVLFSDTYAQASEFFGKMQMLILSNDDIFGDIIPTGTRGPKASVKEAWTGGHVRFRNRADISIRSFGTGTRGLHPDLIICDDILSDHNSATMNQRAKVWKYFVGTIEPMLGPKGQLVVIGTAQHYSDLLHRLRRVEGWHWVKYRSVNWDTERVLWPERHDIEDLRKKQGMDAVLFAKEYQNDPRDDASSYFPFGLTSPALAAGEHMSFVNQYVKKGNEIIVLAADFALSDAIGADFCVVMVAKLDLVTQRRTLLWATREKGWPLQTQVNALRFACTMFDVDFGIVENNSFQRWVRSETEHYPETAGKILGHQTGSEKVSPKDGIPILTLPLTQQLWTFPSGDEQSKRFASIWQGEMNAMGYVNGKLQGVGEHDDTVMCFWLLERAVRLANTLLQSGPQEQYVTMSELGMERARIGNW